MAGDYYEVIRGRIVPELGIDLLERHEESREVAELAARTMDYRSFTNSAILCHFEDVQAENLVGLFNALTGWGADYDEISRLGERISVFKRALNFRLGATRADDRLPKLLREKIEVGGTEGYVPDIDQLLSLYYDVRGWDPATGKPRPDVLQRLGLDAWVDELWSSP
jgi:aldehyde:ferredoxin oxidoreductase